MKIVIDTMPFFCGEWHGGRSSETVEPERLLQIQAQFEWMCYAVQLADGSSLYVKLGRPDDGEHDEVSVVYHIRTEDRE